MNEEQQAAASAQQHEQALVTKGLRLGQRVRAQLNTYLGFAPRKSVNRHLHEMMGFYMGLWGISKLDDPADEEKGNEIADLMPWLLSLGVTNYDLDTVFESMVLKHLAAETPLETVKAKARQMQLHWLGRIFAAKCRGVLGGDGWKKDEWQSVLCGFSQELQIDPTQLLELLDKISTTPADSGAKTGQTG